MVVFPLKEKVVLKFFCIPNSDNKSNVNSLTCPLPYITKEKLVNSRLPEHMLSGGWQLDPHLERDTWVWFANTESICEIIHKFQEGAWPAN